MAGISLYQAVPASGASFFNALDKPTLTIKGLVRFTKSVLRDATSVTPRTKVSFFHDLRCENSPAADVIMTTNQLYCFSSLTYCFAAPPMCFSGCNNTMCTFTKKTKFVAGSFHCFVRHFLNVHMYMQHYKDVMTLDYEISWTRFCELFAFLDVEVNELLSGYLVGNINESDNWPISKTSSICIQCALVTFANFFFFFFASRLCISASASLN